MVIHGIFSLITNVFNLWRDDTWQHGIMTYSNQLMDDMAISSTYENGDTWHIFIDCFKLWRDETWQHGLYVNR